MRSRAPGWYLDPDEPDRLRYWNGDAWTNRRRRRPLWSLASAEWSTPSPTERDLNQPVRRDRARRGAHRPLHPTPAPSLGRDVAVPGAPQRRPDADRGGSARSRGRRSPLVRRLRVRFNGVVAGLVALALVVGTVELSRPRVPAAEAFVAQAPGVCAAFAAASPVVALPASASALRTVAEHVDQLAAKLAALPSATGAGQTVQLWLSGLRRFADDERAYASAMGPPPDAAAPGLARGAAAVRSSVDSFATAHGLSACSLASLGVPAT